MSKRNSVPISAGLVLKLQPEAAVMEEWRRKKIEDVYAKWEKKNSRQERSKPRMNGHAAPPQVSK